MFEYDTQSALDLKEHERQDRAGVSIYDISYASPRGGRVSAFLLVPARDTLHPGLLFMHPSGADRYAFLEEANVFCQGGAVALLIDAPHARPPQQPFLSFTARDRDDLIQAVVDLRRGVDLLIARPDVDARRIGYVGFSYGATVGAMLAGIEKRIKAYIIWGGGARLTNFLRGRGKAIPKAKLETYLEMMTALDSIYHVSHAAPSALFFQNGRLDKNVPEHEAEDLHQAASEPKRIAWYDAGHALNVQACRDRYDWLGEHLNLAPLSPALMKELGKFKLKQMVRPKQPGGK
jgi:dienelactone hydrolase